ncbi:EAL domain-containing protein [Oceanospirillum sp.]|uniref:sensor domain-containing phosphodiesterase n=1 Tax=Oceanospirillum sp. TaxID=2021254 RepID=UPI003A8FB097
MSDLQQSFPNITRTYGEEERLKELSELEIIESEPEAQYDQLVMLMSLTFSVPIAGISFIDQNRQWFKSEVGLNQKEFSLEDSFCNEANLKEDFLVIPDTHQHPDFKKHSLVISDPKVRFYASVPIRSPAGTPIGCCCIMDTAPRQPDKNEIRQLTLFAHLAEAQIQLHAETLCLKKQAVNTAYYDALTGLPNHSLFIDRLDQALMSISDSSQISVCVVHLCRFDELNHARGKEWADKVMFYTAIRLRGSLPISNTVARLEGAKLAVFSVSKGQAQDNRNSHKKLAKRILELCEQEIRVEGAVLHVPVKLGVSHYPGTGSTPDALLEQAKSSSKRGKTINYFSKELSSESNRRFEVEQHLQQALNENRFHVEYQPIVDIQSGKLRSLEALLRLNVDDGPISPGEFIPVAEDTGLILPVGEWVLRTVCRQIGTWRSHMRDNPMPVAVNLASEQMGLKNLSSLVLSAIYDNDLRHSQLQLEVTETSLMKNIDRAIQNMEEILRHGVHFSLDDFGTGYSSLSYLQRLPVTKVKLDRAFIQNIDTNKHDRILAKNIINLCHELNKITVAEGIETQSQLDTLRELGCDLGQGYFFSRPLTTEAINERIISSQLIFP